MGWSKDLLHEGDVLFTAQEVAYQLFHVLIRLKDFLGEQVEVLDEDENSTFAAEFRQVRAPPFDEIVVE